MPLTERPLLPEPAVSVHPLWPRLVLVPQSSCSVLPCWEMSGNQVESNALRPTPLCCCRFVS